MGNCINSQSKVKWDESMIPTNRSLPDSPVRLHEDDTSSEDSEEESYFGNSSGRFSNQLKLKMTKDQLQDLLRSVDVLGLSMEDLHKLLVKLSNKHHFRRSPWRPSLRSIPELN